MTAVSELFALDTNIISKAVRGTDGTRARLLAMPHACLRLPSVVLAELEYASLRAADPATRRGKWMTVLNGMPVLSFDDAAATMHASLRLQLRHAPIGERDLLIAATALAHGCGVVSNNRKAFERVSGLRLVDLSG